ncbi:MAG TPA: hypothetical protein VL728_05615 [Cyclobacteriaceae bacterium]|jgi:hypothetical protein|nr:hypothetical protein [Cyclobacteriaceae bacterium]
MEKIRKEIHLPPQIVKDLKIVAAHADKSVKKYMEDLVVHDVKLQMIKTEKPQ